RPRARPRCGCGHVAPLPEGSILRDVLGWKYVTEDWDNDWLIFKSGPSEMGVHPTHSVWEGKLMITRDSTRSRSCAMTSMRRWMSGGRKARSSEAPIEQREYSRVIM